MKYKKETVEKGRKIKKEKGEINKKERRGDSLHLSFSGPSHLKGIS